MSGRSIVIIAVLAYLAVVGCVIWPQGSGSVAAPPPGGDDSELLVKESFSASLPSAPPLAAPLEGLPYRGVVMQVQQIGDMTPYEKNIDEIAALGADTVSISVDARQENGTSTAIFLDQRLTPTSEQLVKLVRHAKSKNLRVVLMPIVLMQNPRGNEWRGNLKPDSWEDWFISYREMMKHFAIIASASGVDVLSVGSELVTAQDRTDQWHRTIRMVRKIFPGKLTYSANWDAYARVPFWDQLDLVGMNAYYTLGNDGKVGVDEIVRRWRAIQRDLMAFQRRVNRPIIFLEVGWCSLANAASEPWDYTRTSLAVDLDLQRKLYEGFFEAWQGNPNIAGFLFWEWPIGNGGPEDKGYTPENKPAEKVLRTWLAKPWK
jgi:hypothetical protein